VENRYALISNIPGAKLGKKPEFQKYFIKVWTA
jgi:hypothetical protein